MCSMVVIKSVKSKTYSTQVFVIKHGLHEFHIKHVQLICNLAQLTCVTYSKKYIYIWSPYTFRCALISLNITNIMLGPFYERLFHHNLNSMEISFCSHSSCSKVIAILSWRVLNCVTIWYPTMELHQTNIDGIRINSLRPSYFLYQQHDML